MQTLLTVKSLTYAQKGQRLLEQYWIHASVIRTPEQIARRGCSYALLVRNDSDRAAKLLEQVGIQVLGKYSYPLGKGRDR